MPKTRKKKRHLPLNLAKLLQSATTIGQAADLPIYIDLFYAQDTPCDLVELLQRAFSSDAKDAFITESYYAQPSDFEPELPVDFCVLVADSSLRYVTDMLYEAFLRGIPCVVVYETGASGHESHACPEQKPHQILADKAADKGGDERFLGPASTLDEAVPAAYVCTSRPHRKQDEDAHDTLCAEFIRIDPCRPEQGLSALGEWIVRSVEPKRLALARAFPFIRSPLASSLVMSNAIANGAIGLVFFMPGADLPAITLNQAILILELARIQEHKLDTERIKEVVAVIGAAYGYRALARICTALLPFWIAIFIRAGIAFGGTILTGKAAQIYYQEADLMSKAQNTVEDLRDYSTQAKDAAHDAAKTVHDAAQEARETVAPHISDLADTVSSAAKAAGPVAAKGALAALGAADIAITKASDLLKNVASSADKASQEGASTDSDVEELADETTDATPPKSV